MRGRRQNGRPVRGTFFFLHFEFGGQDRGRSSRDRYGAGFRATVTVEDFRCVAGGDDFCECGQGRPHDVYSTYQFIRPAIRKNLVNHQRQHLEGLWLAAAGKGESAGDIVDEQAVGFALCPAL